ncbi:MAG: DUF177 domain-containing protein [Bacteroidetes bacterium CHB6]|nr:DUF177 domain-containing protein [Bacteroidetes bacterium CHB6]
MDKMSKYNLHYAGLKDGIHEFEYLLKQDFFDMFEHPLVQGANVLIHLTVTKSAVMVVLDIKVSGTVHVECHRCLEEFEIPLDMHKTIIVKTTGDDNEVDGDNIIRADNAHDIHLAQHFYDVVSLSIPLKVTHPDNASGGMGCNEETLRTIAKYMVKNEKQDDPRWDLLKKINNN